MPVDINEILKLPKEEQESILEAIQDNLEGAKENDALSNEHISFIKERIKNIEDSNDQTYSWEEVKEQLRNRWSFK